MGSEHWRRAVNAATNTVRFVDAMQLQHQQQLPRIGRQDKESGYDRQTQIPHPPVPQAPNQYPQQFGEASGYFHGHPQSPFAPTTGHQQQNPPPLQQGYASPPPVHSPTRDQSYGRAPYIPQYDSGYGNSHNDNYGGSGSSPLSPVNSNYVSGPSYSAQPGPSHDYTPRQYGPTYIGSPEPVRRSSTVPVMDAYIQPHDCADHYNEILGRCLICNPTRRTQTSAAYMN